MLYPNFDELAALKKYAGAIALTSDGAVTSVSAGDNSSPFHGQGLEFEEVREYAPGDDIRSIDWRVTARTGRAHTKLFREERERSVILCVDMNVTMRFGTRGTFKSVQAARVASLLGWKANGNGNRLGACVFGDVPGGMRFFAPKRSRSSLWAMLKQLSDENVSVQPQPVTLEDMLQHVNKVASTGALVYVISDFNSIGGGLEKQLGNLQKRCNIVLIAVNDVADYAISPVGGLLCSRHSGEKYHVNTDSQSGRRSYTRIWQENRNQLKRISHRLGIHIISIATNGDVEKDLALELRRISKRRSRRVL